MLYIIRYNNPTSFMKEWAKDPAIKVESAEGKIQTTSMSYKKSNVPGTKVLFTPKYADGQMQIALTQDELNAEVRRLNAYDKDGVLLTEAPLGTNNHDFWLSEYVYLWIEAGEAKLNDDLPRDKILLAAMRKDKSFYFKSENAKPFVKGVSKWVVTKLEGNDNEIVEEEGPAMKAAKLLMSMNHERKLSIARIMGRPVDNRTDPEIVTAILFRIITTEKGEASIDGKTNLQKFLELATSSDSELNLDALANDSKAFFEKRNGCYYYGEIKMGKNIAEIAMKLKSDMDLIQELDNKRKK